MLDSRAKEVRMPQNVDPKKVRKAPADPELQNEGEGSRSAARRYDQAAQDAAKDPEHVKKAAEAAERALKGPAGKELRAAEERGKKHQHR
jgi:hypothetical protein